MLTLDVALPISLYAFVQMAFICLGTVGVIVSVNPWYVNQSMRWDSPPFPFSHTHHHTIDTGSSFS